MMNSSHWLHVKRANWRLRQENNACMVSVTKKLKAYLMLLIIKICMMPALEMNFRKSMNAIT